MMLAFLCEGGSIFKSKWSKAQKLSLESLYSRADTAFSSCLDLKTGVVVTERLGVSA